MPLNDTILVRVFCVTIAIPFLGNSFLSGWPSPRELQTCVQRYLLDLIIGLIAFSCLISFVCNSLFIGQANNKHVHNKLIVALIKFNLFVFIHL